MHRIRLVDQRQIYIDDRKISQKLSKKQGELLSALMRIKGVVSYDMMLNQIYAGMDEPQTYKIMSVMVCNIRRKLGDDHRDLIETVWGRGWMLNRERYEVVTSSPVTASVEIPLEYLDSICFITGEDAQTAVMSLVKQKYRQLQEM